MDKKKGSTKNVAAPEKGSAKNVAAPEKGSAKNVVTVETPIPEEPKSKFAEAPDKVNEKDPHEEELEQMDVEDIRAHILDYYGINQEEEVERKEKKAQRFRAYVSNSGLQTAFQLVISEILSQNVPAEDFFKFASKRLKDIGKEYYQIKECIDNGQAPKNILDEKIQPPKSGKKEEAKPAPAKKAKK